jgi:hypothetical protein
MMVRSNYSFGGARRDSANALKLRLLAALSGVTLTLACSGSSEPPADPHDSGGDAGKIPVTQTGGSTALGGAGGSTGGSTALAGSSGSAGQGGVAGSSGSNTGGGLGGSAGVGDAGGLGGAAGLGGTAGSGAAAGLGGRGGFGGTSNGGGDPGGTGHAAGSPGRPFLVQGHVRTSELELTPAWRAPTLCASAATDLDAETRRALAEYFARAGLMEHASVAAFARFSLQLLALGAPPELVAAATRAMADETRHAQHCFELASRYAGTDLGPGALDVDGALGAVELLEVVDMVVAEGCIGETAAALEARWAAESATEPEVRAVLLGIADDESRHAALAWEFVAWAAQRDAQVPARVRAAIDAARREQALSAPDARGARADASHSKALAAHGVLSESARSDARAVVLREILPELAASLGARLPAGAAALQRSV